MTTNTQAEFRDIVAGHLKVLAAGEALSPEDAVTTNKVIVAVHEELQELKIAYWPLTAIPVAVVGALKRVVAADLAHDFLPLLEARDYESKRDVAITQIRKIVATVRPNLPNKAVYF